MTITAAALTRDFGITNPHIVVAGLNPHAGEGGTMGCEDLEIAKPVLRRIEGWTEDITGIRRFEDLPKAAQEYVTAAGQLIGSPVSIVSVGPDREQTIHVPY